jgi:hypothetical protein
MTRMAIPCEQERESPPLWKAWVERAGGKVLQKQCDRLSGIS